MLVVTTLIALGLGLTWQFWPWWKERVLVSQLRQQIIGARDSAEAGKAYRLLLRPDKRQRIERLANDTDPSIALKASFELLADRSAVWARVSPQKRDQFLSVLKEKARLTPPEWWSAALLENVPSPNDSVFGYAEKVTDGESVILQAGGRQLRLTPGQFQSITGSDDPFAKGCALHIERRRSYLAICDNLGWGNELYCLDTATGNQNWEAQVWSLGVRNLEFSSGTWSHGLQIVMDDSRVIVWGTGTGGSYVEAFDAVTGQCQLRFCSENWYVEMYQ